MKTQSDIVETLMDDFWLSFAVKPFFKQLLLVLSMRFKNLNTSQNAFSRNGINL